jgi:hypothetical protein
MSRMRSVDGSGIHAQCLEAQAVCERSPLQHRRNPDKTWPFLFSYKGEAVYINRAKRTTKAQAARMVEDALL